jgi:pimeloyl-ACP methyl ester carboxylesterase
MARPRILLVPTATEVEWKIKPLLSEWAEVASFDAPGVGDEPMTSATAQAIVDRGLAELDRLGWDSWVVAGDEIGAPQAVRIAAARPEGLRGLVLGHASLSLTRTGSRPRIREEMVDALVRMAEIDFRSYVRALTQLTQQAYDDELADRYMERVKPDVVAAYMSELLGPVGQEDLEPMIRSLDVPLLMVEHKGCLMWTPESFEDATAAFPDATTASMELKPSVNPEFADLLREFCSKLPAPTRGSASEAPTGIEPV